MNNFIKTIFGRLDNAYLIRHYIYGAILFAVMLLTSPTLPALLFFSLCLILYPFAMFVYDSIVDTLMGNNVLFVNAVLAIIWGIIKTILVFTFTIFIAPIGIGYLYITRLRTEE